VLNVYLFVREEGGLVRGRSRFGIRIQSFVECSEDCFCSQMQALFIGSFVEGTGSCIQSFVEYSEGWRGRFRVS